MGAGGVRVLGVALVLGEGDRLAGALARRGRGRRARSRCRRGGRATPPRAPARRTRCRGRPPPRGSDRPPRPSPEACSAMPSAMQASVRHQVSRSGVISIARRPSATPPGVSPASSRTSERADARPPASTSGSPGRSGRGHRGLGRRRARARPRRRRPRLSADQGLGQAEAGIGPHALGGQQGEPAAGWSRSSRCARSRPSARRSGRRPGPGRRAAAAWWTASSIAPAARCQAAARRCRAATSSGAASVSSWRSSSPKRWW